MPSIHFVRIIIAAALLTASLPATAQSSTITYQGQLRENGEPVTDNVNLEFRLYDELTGGSPVGTEIQRLNWPVEDGLFQVELDFGAAAFDGGERFLEVEVNGAPLSPRQRVTATPYALRAASTSAGAVDGGAVDPAEVQLRVGGLCPSGQAMRGVKENGEVICSPFWSTAGNAVSGGDFLGTTNSERLELRTANRPVMRIFDAERGDGTHVPNLLLGSENNVLDDSGGPLVGAAILGGGGTPTQNLCGASSTEPCINTVAADYATVAGGLGNYATGDRALAWGTFNTASGSSATAWGSETEASGLNATAMGFITRASGDMATAMGNFSEASGNSSLAAGEYADAFGAFSAAIGRDVTASGSSAIALGDNTMAGGAFSMSVGRNARVRDAQLAGEVDVDGNCTADAGECGDEGTFVWADSSGDFFTSSAPNQFLVRAAGGAVITGDSANGDPLDNRLRVDGTLRLDTPANGGTVDLCWNLLAQISLCSSSARYKRDIVDLDLGLATALRLQAVGYRWKGNGAADIGFVAEDVAAIDERLVTRNGDGEVEGVKYDRLTAVLANAVQEIDRRHQSRQQALHDLSRQVGSLTEENASLRAELADIRRRQDHELEGLRAELAMLRELLAPQLAESDAP